MKPPTGNRSRSVIRVWIWTVIGALWLSHGNAAETRTPVNKFEKDILAFEAADRKSPPPAGAILFAGDSQFTRWKTIHEDLPEYSVINRGFGGSQMTDLLQYTDRIVIPYRPRLIVINEGGNDLHAGRTPDQLLADFKAFVEKVRAALPETRIIMSSLTPSPARWSEIETRTVVNRRLQDYIATQKNVVFVDLFDAYLGADGKPNDEYFVADHLHHSAAGYQVRLKFTRPLLGKPDKQ
jgi:lysophospholipase L1-like esterase